VQRATAVGLNARFAFDAPSSVETPEGGTKNDWPEQLECWGDFRLKGAGDNESAGGVHPSMQSRLGVRVAAQTLAIATNWRARDVSKGAPGVVWNITAIEPPVPGAALMWLRLTTKTAA